MTTRDEEERKYLEAIRWFGTPEEITELLKLYRSPHEASEFRKRVDAILQRRERELWLRSAFFRFDTATIAIGAGVAAIGGTILNFRALIAWLSGGAQ